MNRLISPMCRNYFNVIITKLYLIFWILFISACVKPPDTPEPQPFPVSQAGAYILNEGNYQWGNARLDYLSFNSNSISKDVFKSTNKRPLGDVLQSASFIRGDIWLVVNNSGKIEIINPKDCSSIRTITGLQSPRYVLPVSDDDVWVSDLYANGIHILSSGDFEKKGFISLPGWTEQMSIHSTGVWVTNVRRSFVYLLNPITNQIIDSVSVGLGNQNILQDLAGNLWILASGDQNTNIPGRITCVDPETRQVIQEFIFPSPGGSSLVMSRDKQQLYYIYNGSVWSLSLLASSLSDIPFFTGSTDKLIYGLAVHPKKDRLFMMDARDYVSEGYIYEYSYNGEFLNQYTAGIIPSGMIFVE